MSAGHTSENVKTIARDFHIPQLGRHRRVWAYLPPGYYTCQKHYPVLYMHDGQNLFDRSANEFHTEWGVDKTLDRLIAGGGPEAIVVAVDHAGRERIDEFSPWRHPKLGGGKGQAYARFLAESLKPFVDRAFRTMPDRLHTGLMGSSMGGLATIYAGLEYHHVFGMLGIFSPSIWFSSDIFPFLKGFQKNLPTKAYIMAGKKESTHMGKDTLAFSRALAATGFGPKELKTVLRAEGEHSEAFWGHEFAEAYTWLFKEPPMPPGNAHLYLFPEPAHSHLHIVPSYWTGQADVEITGSSGTGLKIKAFNFRTPVNIEFLAPGPFTVSVKGGKYHWQKQGLKS